MYKCYRCGWLIEQRTRVQGWMTCPVCQKEYPASYSYVYGQIREELERSLSPSELIVLVLAARATIGAVYALYRSHYLQDQANQISDDASLADLPACLA